MRMSKIDWYCKYSLLDKLFLSPSLWTGVLSDDMAGTIRNKTPPMMMTQSEADLVEEYLDGSERKLEAGSSLIWCAAYLFGRYGRTKEEVFA